MGGDTFEGVQKLTNAEYLQITEELIQKLNHLCIKIQPYIPLPQKQIHGDIDFLVILKPQFKAKNIVQELKIQKFIFNNNDSINSIYKNKQVDFLIVSTEKEFEMVLFYKSHGGFGGFLGFFLPSRQVKLTHFGLIALRILQNIKFQFTLTQDIYQILQFYGLDIEIYKKGFKTREEIFQYMRTARFLDEEKFASYEGKGRSKLMLAFAEYLKQKGFDKKRQTIIFQKPLQQALKFFKKQEEFELQFQNLMSSIKRKQKLNKKFNGKHIIEKYEFKNLKQVDKCKLKFYEYFKDKQKYYNYVEENELETILKEFGQKCGLKENE